MDAKDFVEPLHGLGPRHTQQPHGVGALLICFRAGCGADSAPPSDLPGQPGRGNVSVAVTTGPPA